MKAVITYFDDIEQGSERWHEEREGMYTGSNADKLLTSPGAIVIDGGVITQYAHASASNFTGNFWTKRGHTLEDEAIEIYEAIHNLKVRKTGLIKNSLFPGCIYSPDGLDDDNCILLEVKCFSAKNHQALLDGHIPFKILAQIHYGLLISGRKKAKLIAYNPKRDDDGNPIFKVEDQYREIVVRWDRDIANNFKSKLKVVA